MENNENNPKPQETGGLKLMTVFIGVLALHVVVIGGFTVYHLMSGGGTDADLVTDKTHKSVKVTPDSAISSETATTDTANIDKGTTTPAATSSENTGNPVIIPAPPTDATPPAPQSVATSAPIIPPSAPSGATAPVAPATVEPTANAPSGPMQPGPVITPPNSPAQVATESTAPLSSDSRPDSSGGKTYVVKAHDSLAHIAHHNHVKIAALRSANGLKTDKLHLGQKLIIPAKTEVASSSGASESSESVSKAGPDRTLLGDSPIFSKSVSSTRHDKAAMTASGSSHHTYTVAKGDTLSRIAHKFHTSSSALMALNSISDARKLHPGQKLKIPALESRSATSTPAATPTAEPDRIEPRATPSAQLANFIN